MDLDDLLVVHQHQAVTQFIEEGPELIRILVVLPGDDKLGTVGEGNVLGVEIGEVRLLLYRRFGRGFGGGDVLSPHGEKHGLQHQQPPLAAGIHNAGLFQHRVLVDGIGQSDLCLRNGGLLDKLNVVVLLGGLHGLGRGQPGNRQDGALGGLHNRLIGGIHALLKGLGPQYAVAYLRPLQLPGQAPEQQGQNHAGVAPGAPQHGGSGNLGRGIELRILRLAQVGGRGVDGHGHIGAGIAVGNREHVQFIEILLVDLDRGGGTDDHSSQLCPVDGLPQLFTPPKINRSS